MMKLWSLLFLLLFVSPNVHAADGQNARLMWKTNYDEALREARSTKKPLLILFTGSDWCTWCIKLEKESLNSPEFAEMTADKFVFLKLDFPLNKSLPPEMTAFNKSIQKRFNVSGFPTIVLVDPTSERLIGTVGYRPGGGKQYASNLLKMIDDHSTYLNKMQKLGQQPLSGADLKHLYEGALELGEVDQAHQIAKIGVESDQKHFFLLERYRHLAEKNENHTNEGIEIRQQLLAADPHHLKLICYQVALIDFEAASRESESNSSPEATVASLIEYIDKFGATDRDNLWRLQMIIAQVYFDKDKLEQALEYAQHSYQSAPPTAQPEIATAIKSIQAKLSK